MDWKTELESIGCVVAGFTVCMFRTGWAAFPAVATARIPERHDVKARAEDALSIERGVFSILTEPFPGKPRIDAECIDLEHDNAMFSVELGAGWIRFYFRAPTDCGQSRDELLGQEPAAWRVVPRIMATLTA